jgi:S1-C subfamily serine protease
MQPNNLMNPGDFPPQPEPKPKSTGWETVRRFLTLRTQFSIVLFICLAVLSGFLALLIFNLTQPPPQHLTQNDINQAVGRALASPTPTPSYESQVYQIISPSVVNVSVSISTPGAKSESGLGSGVVIDDAGTILTCWHVIRNATSIKVQFADGTESEAAVISSQEQNDLAVLQPKIIPDNLVPATLASASTLQIGDQVVAVGSPFGLSGTLTSGVVSGLGRTFKTNETGQTLTNLIQFDAAVNPGNSGGPLVDRSGEVVGIVEALLNPTDQSFFVGIGFAVPIEIAASALGPPWW